MTLPGFPDAASLAGLAGGVLIGLAAALMLLGIGRIAGVSGVLARAVGLSGGTLPRASAWSFVLGLPLGAATVALATGQGVGSFPGPVPLVVAGLLVGFGTRLGSGCTSGHGVCGVSRWSQRSLVATVVFMASGIATVALADAVFPGLLP
ncbi:YeeE/YedE family protein [Tsuneonella sp. YG55]|uniref:YeeE/YedE family protein n=1 Tax=Tsuneonella litorea TaxID=2976475 RepID=A0A9X2W1M1_9SPHN|nr:YeeE/YedE family protein [Tsuneonella litorea]MCT2558973.1 YeeE/YedE family protein [Tsuneonella litorea]